MISYGPTPPPSLTISPLTYATSRCGGSSTSTPTPPTSRTGSWTPTAIPRGSTRLLRESTPTRYRMSGRRCAGSTPSTPACSPPSTPPPPTTGTPPCGGSPGACTLSTTGGDICTTVARCGRPPPTPPPTCPTPPPVASPTSTSATPTPTWADTKTPSTSYTRPSPSPNITTTSPTRPAPT